MNVPYLDLDSINGTTSFFRGGGLSLDVMITHYHRLVFHRVDIFFMSRYIRPDARRVKPSYYLGLTKSPRHSDVESDLESSASESELESDDLIDDELGAPSPSWKSWCVVV